MYFGTTQVRALLRSLFIDLYKYKAVEQIRRENENTRDRDLIEREFRRTLKATRFLGVGWYIVVVRMALRKRYGEFRLALVPYGAH